MLELGSCPLIDNVTLVHFEVCQLRKFQSVVLFVFVKKFLDPKDLAYYSFAGTKCMVTMSIALTLY